MADKMNEKQVFAEMENWSDEELLAFVSEIEEKSIVKAPKRMKADILAKSREQKTKPPVFTKKKSKQIEMFFYSLKITAAVTAAVFGLFFIRIEDMEYGKTPFSQWKKAEMSFWDFSERKQTEAENDMENHISEKINQFLDEKSTMLSTGLNHFSNAVNSKL